MKAFFDIDTQIDFVFPAGALYGVGAAFYLAPPGADRTADLTVWKQRTNRGEPFTPDVTAFLGELHRFHSVAGIPLTAPAHSVRIPLTSVPAGEESADGSCGIGCGCH